jgi:predicted nucleic acid-binding Zn ribbon protein
MSKPGRNRKGEFLPIRDAIRDLLNSYHLEGKFDEAQVVASWERLVGGPIARRTRKVFVKNKVLFVEFKTAAMKNDFLLHKSKVLELFQKEFGNQVIVDIAIL